MQTSTSLTFFTAIFVALGGALAEELMIYCRHVRTELYIYIYRLYIYIYIYTFMSTRVPVFCHSDATILSHILRYYNYVYKKVIVPLLCKNNIILYIENIHPCMYICMY